MHYPDEIVKPGAAISAGRLIGISVASGSFPWSFGEGYRDCCVHFIVFYVGLGRT